MHWDHLAAAARAQGVHIEGPDLAVLPHDVAISQEIRSRVARAAR